MEHINEILQDVIDQKEKLSGTLNRIETLTTRAHLDISMGIFSGVWNYIAYVEDKMNNMKEILTIINKLNEKYIK